MALQIETIRATADRVAASYQLEVVDLEFTGGSKHRTLRVFLEKNSEAREKIAAAAHAQFAIKHAADAASATANPEAEEEVSLPTGVPIEMLSFVTHEDCASFAHDFSTVLDVEDLVPGAEYTLEVSSPGLERKLLKPADYQRFQGSLAKIQTFTAIDSNRHFTGRLTAFTEARAPTGPTITLDLSAVKQKGKPKKSAAAQTVQVPIANIEKANLLAEI